MGARYGYLYKLSEQSYASLQSQSINVSASASYSGAVYSGGASASVGTSSSNSQKFSSAVSETKIFSIGSVPPTDNSATTWANDAITEPMPIKYELRPLTDVFNNRFFDLKQFKDLKLDIGSLYDNLKTAMTKYCDDYLLPQKYVKNCAAPKADSVITVKIVTPVTVEDGKWVTLTNIASGKCLTEIYDNQVQSNSCTSNNIHQMFRFIYMSNAFKIISASGKSLDINRASNDNGGIVQTYDNNNGDNQRFTVSKDGDYYKFAAKNSGKCIDVKSGNTAEYATVQQYDCVSGYKEEQWQAFTADSNPITTGNWAYIKAYNTNLCFSDQGNANQIRLKTCNKGGDQKFKFEYLNNGYRVTNNSSGRVFDIDHASGDNGRALTTYSINDDANQRFFVLREGDYYKIQGLNSKKCIDFSDNWKDGQGVYQYSCGGGNNNQKFKIEQA